MSKDIEHRILCKDVRVDTAGATPIIRGYAALFNTLSEDLGGFREQLQAGAFSDALSQSDVRALINHDPNLVLGRNRSGTLVLREDATGLYAEITPPDTASSHDLIELMKRGDVNQMSFAFNVAREDQIWTREGTGPWLRTIKRVSNLYDVSIVTYPAYPQTTAAVRALEAMQTEGSAALAAAQAELVRRQHIKRDLQLLQLLQPALP